MIVCLTENLQRYMIHKLDEIYIYNSARNYYFTKSISNRILYFSLSHTKIVKCFFSWPLNPQLLKIASLVGKDTSQIMTYKLFTNCKIK